MEDRIRFVQYAHEPNKCHIEINDIVIAVVDVEIVGKQVLVGFKKGQRTWISKSIVGDAKDFK